MAFEVFKPRELVTSIDGLEIGATGPNRLQFVVMAAKRRVVVKLTAEEARWLASALNHWADESGAISPVKLAP
jgi:hypothetical protein